MPIRPTGNVGLDAKRSPAFSGKPGNSTGLRKAIGLRLGRAGARVPVSYAHNKARAERTLAEYKAAGIETLLVRADVAQVMGKDSNDWLGTVGLAHVFMPQWPVAPFVGVGGGWLHVSPKDSRAKDHTDPTVYGSLGFRGYLSDQFLLQAEYRGFVVFPSHDDNEEIDEWLVGFTYFF